MPVRVQKADFDLGAEIAALHAGRPSIGAVASSVSAVRGINDGTGVSEMELERYPGMTRKALAGIVSAAMQHWGLIDALVIHRVDKLRPQGQIVLVAVASKHRGESFAAYEFVMGYPKGEAPFWKKEQMPEDARWVDVHITNDKALARWSIASNNAASSMASQPGASV